MRIGITLTSSLEVDQKYIDLTDQVAITLAKQNHGIVYGGTAYGMMLKLAESYKNAGGNDLCGVIAQDLIAVTKKYEKYTQLDTAFLVRSMEERKEKIISLSDAYIILPGGYGTFEEIASIIDGQANKLHAKPIAFYNFEGYYDTLFTFLDEMYSKKFSKIAPNELYFSSNNLNKILNFFENYSKTELADKFIEKK